MEIDIDGEVTCSHYQINQRYKIQFEVGAVKGVTGWKIEANGDDINSLIADIVRLKAHAELMATSAPAVTNG